MPGQVCEVRGQSSGVGSLSTMWIRRTEFRSAGLAATTLTHWAISPVLTSFSVIKTNKQNHVEGKENSSAVRSTHSPCRGPGSCFRSIDHGSSQPSANSSSKGSAASPVATQPWCAHDVVYPCRQNTPTHRTLNNPGRHLRW